MNLDGLVTGRIVYYVLDAQDADTINLRRTSKAIGNPITAGDVQPAQVVRVHDPKAGVVNLRVALDGSDTYWATNVAYSTDQRPGTWRWMYEGQGTRGSAR